MKSIKDFITDPIVGDVTILFVVILLLAIGYLSLIQTPEESTRILPLDKDRLGVVNPVWISNCTAEAGSLYDNILIKIQDGWGLGKDDTSSVFIIGYPPSNKPRIGVKYTGGLDSIEINNQYINLTECNKIPPYLDG